MNNISGYNERLFESGSLRSKLHNSRFEWFRRVAAKYFPQPVKAIEIGCFDGRLLSYFPTPPIKYEGFDAGWEGGLDVAREKFKGNAAWRFSKATDPGELSHLQDNSFQVAVSLETLEHVPAADAGKYLEELARVTKGYLVVSVPNEKGIVFLTKYLAKKALHGASEGYRPSEVINATLGRMGKVRRHEHKGFDYLWMKSLISRHFELLEIGGLPFASLPPALSFSVTFVAQSRK
ncbi:MAG: methyltransferase domain-containing protein [Rhodomicrobium sp.]